MSTIDLEEGRLQYEPQEPEYNRNNMIPHRIRAFNYNINLRQMLTAYNLNEAENRCVSCVRFNDVTAIDEGGLAKEWFTKDYTSQAVIKYIAELENFDEIVKDYTNHKFEFIIKQILILGYINYKWLYISNDLLDALYIIQLIINEQRNCLGPEEEYGGFEEYCYDNRDINCNQDFNILFNNIFTIIKHYLANLNTNEVNSTISIDLNSVPLKIRKAVRYMLKKIKNECEEDEINYINREQMTAFLYFLEFQHCARSIDRYNNNRNSAIILTENSDYNSDNEEMTEQTDINNQNRILEAEYYLLRIIKVLYNQSKEEFKETIRHISIDLNADNLKNFYLAITETIPNATNNFEDFKAIYESIFDTLQYMLPSEIETESAAYYYLLDGKPPDLYYGWNTLLLYGHLVNNNNIINKEKLLNVINYEGHIQFIEEEKQKIRETIINMSNEECIDFLKFVTGSDKLPNTIRLIKSYENIAAHTCNNQLDLPAGLFTIITDINLLKQLLIGKSSFNMAGGSVHKDDFATNLITFVVLGALVIISSLLQ